MASLFIKGISSVNRANHFINVPSVSPLTQIWLEVDGDGTAEYQFEYSLNAGSNWSVIGVSVSDAEWAISSVQYAAIFDGIDSKEVTFRAVKVSDNGVVYTATTMFYKVSTSAVSISPSATTTIGIPGDNPYLVANHTNPLWYLDIINFIWSYEHETPTEAWDIYIEKLNSSGDVVQNELLYDNMGKSYQNLPFNFGHYLENQNPASGQPLMSPGDGKMIWRLKFVGDNIYDNDIIYSSPFCVTTDETQLVNQETLLDAIYRPRIDTFKRIGAEKGFLLDEVPTIAQFEAGEGITITQRDNAGRRAKGDTTADANDVENFKKAYNLVISADIPQYRRSPRAMTAVISPQLVVPEWVAGDVYYGSCFYYDLTHNWDLGNSNLVQNPLYVKNQTVNSFQIQISQVTNNSAYNFANPENEVVPFWQVLSGNTIRIYAIYKNSTYPPTLSKDLVFDTPLTYYFEYRLVEVIPEPAVV